MAINTEQALALVKYRLNRLQSDTTLDASSALESRRVSLGAHWVDSRESTQ